MDIMTVEEMTNNIDALWLIIIKARAKVYLLQSNLLPMTIGQDIGIEDEPLWATGMHSLCEEVVEDLMLFDDLVNNVCDSIKLYSIDPEKIEKQKEHFKSIGIANP